MIKFGNKTTIKWIKYVFIDQQMILSIVIILIVQLGSNIEVGLFNSYEMEVIEIDEKELLTGICGYVTEVSKEPISEVEIRVYKASKYSGLISGSDYQREKRRVRTYLTTKDGRFCFTDLPKGKYQVEFLRSGFDITLLRVSIDPKSKKSIDKQITIVMDIAG
ncbi:MAG: carboxypeptidase-like regulatory domain-containing protein [Acidobacteriota bacterium]